MYVLSFAICVNAINAFRRYRIIRKCAANIRMFYVANDIPNGYMRNPIPKVSDSWAFVRNG